MIILSVPAPSGFSIRSVKIRKKADGFYICVRLQDDSVPDVPAPQQVRTAVGADLGITKLLSLSIGETIPNPRFYKLMERKRSRLNRAACRKVLGSRRRQKAQSANSETRAESCQSTRGLPMENSSLSNQFSEYAER